MQENVVYQVRVATETSMETYVGLASNFETMRHPSGTKNKRNEMELSKYIWNLKDQKK